MSILTVVTSVYYERDLLSITFKSLCMNRNIIGQWIIIDGTPPCDYSLPPLNHDCFETIYINQPDKGIYNAWNSILDLISCPWTLFLGSGDQLSPSIDQVIICKQLEDIPIYFNFAYGTLFKHSNVFPNQYNTNHLNRASLLLPPMPSHTATLTRSNIFWNGGLFDDTLKILADAKFMIYYSNGNYYDLRICLSSMQPGGVSHSSLMWNKKVHESLYIVKSLSLPFNLTYFIIFIIECLKNYPFYWFAYFKTLIS